jgi:hypothetical protein
MEADEPQVVEPRLEMRIDRGEAHPVFVPQQAAALVLSDQELDEDRIAAAEWGCLQVDLEADPPVGGHPVDLVDHCIELVEAVHDHASHIGITGPSKFHPK